MEKFILERRYSESNPSRAGIADQNIHEVSKQTLGGVLTTVLNQVSDKGDVSHPGVIKFNERVLLMVHELIRLIIK